MEEERIVLIYDSKKKKNGKRQKKKVQGKSEGNVNINSEEKRK